MEEDDLPMNQGDPVQEQVPTPKREQVKGVKSKGEPMKIIGSPAAVPEHIARTMRSIQMRKLAFGQARKRRTHKKKMDSRRKKTRRSHKK
jgi:hypothetical protein